MDPSDRRKTRFFVKLDPSDSVNETWVNGFARFGSDEQKQIVSKRWP